MAVCLKTGWQKHLIKVLCLSLIQFCLIEMSWAQEDGNASSKLPLISAVQRRPNSLNKELSGHFSFLPLDHFNTYFAVGLAYTHWFNDYLGWEVLNLNYAKNSPTGLEDYLVGTFGANPETFDILEYYGTSNIIYSPLFMKHLFKSESVVWGDLSLVAGGGLAKLERNGNINVFDFGGMVRFFSGPNWIYRLDLRQYIFTSSAVKPNMAISFAVSYNFGKEEQKVEVLEDED